MNPREIEVHIEELVLHSFDPRARWSIADAAESELRSLLVERGLPGSWQKNPERIDAGLIRLTKMADENGRQIAGAVYRGGSK
jgi:hypothetical protein